MDDFWVAYSLFGIVAAIVHFTNGLRRWPMWKTLSRSLSRVRVWVWGIRDSRTQCSARSRWMYLGDFRRFLLKNRKLFETLCRLLVQKDDLAGPVVGSLVVISGCSNLFLRKVTSIDPVEKPPWKEVHGIQDRSSP